MNMGNRIFHTLYIELRNRLMTKEGVEKAAAEELKDQIEEGIDI